MASDQSTKGQKFVTLLLLFWKALTAYGHIQWLEMIQQHCSLLVSATRTRLAQTQGHFKQSIVATVFKVFEKSLIVRNCSCPFFEKVSKRGLLGLKPNTLVIFLNYARNN